MGLQGEISGVADLFERVDDGGPPGLPHVGEDVHEGLVRLAGGVRHMRRYDPAA